MTEILFVHGALVRDGSWWWQAVADLVRRTTGVRSRAVALPSCGESGAPTGSSGLLEDAAALRRELDAVDGGALVVGHSYGGTVMAEGADHAAARHLLYISSYLPHPGTSQAQIMTGESDPVAVAAGGDGTLHVEGYDESSFAARFLDDVSDSRTRSAAWKRVGPQGAGAFLTPTSRAAWRDRPSTCIVCTADRSTSPELQRLHAARATRSVDLHAGHHPFLSQPELVAEQVARILQTMR